MYARKSLDLFHNSQKIFQHISSWECQVGDAMLSLSPVKLESEANKSLFGALYPPTHKGLLRALGWRKVLEIQAAQLLEHHHPTTNIAIVAKNISGLLMILWNHRMFIIISFLSGAGCCSMNNKGG